MITEKIVKLSHLTLTPALLFAARDAVATEGKIHASAHSFVRVDGNEYASADENASPDVLVSRPALAKKAAELWAEVGQALADDAGVTVEYAVNGQVRKFTPAK